MQALSEVLSVMAGVLFTLGFVPYIYSFVWGDADPKRSSWFIWATNETVLLWGMAVKNSDSWMMWGSATGTWVVAGLLLRYGTSGWDWKDKVSLCGASVAALLWLASRDANFGIFMSLAIVAFGACPTVMSAWEDPAAENKWAWTVIFSACPIQVAACFVGGKTAFSDLAQPITFLVIDAVIFSIVWFRPLFIRGRAGVTAQVVE